MFQNKKMDFTIRFLDYEYEIFDNPKCYVHSVILFSFYDRVVAVSLLQVSIDIMSLYDSHQTVM